MSTNGHSLDGFEAALRDDNLGDRTIEEYVAIVKRGLAFPDPMAYIKGIANAGSRMMPIAAFQHWAIYTENTEMTAALAAYKKTLRHRVPPRKERQPFSDKEMLNMATCVPRAGRSIAECFALKVLLRTGARASDISKGITREALQTAMQSDGWAEIRTKGQRLRKVQFKNLAADVKALLAVPGWDHLYELLAPAHGDREVSNKRGYRVLDLRFKALCALAKVSQPHITHRCRHTLASQLFAQSNNLLKVKEWFNWASATTVEKYTHTAKVAEIQEDFENVLPDFSGDKPKTPRGKKR